jgi:hypothetical protein
LPKQRDAQLDIEELLIRDRQQDRRDAQEAAKAQRILNDPRKARFQDAARDALALIDVQDRQRANAIAEKQSTVNGSIVNGRLLQSVPGTGSAPGVQPLGPLTSAPGSAAQGAASALPTVEVLVTLDSQPIAAKVITRLRQGGRASDAAGGGQT